MDFCQIEIEDFPKLDLTSMAYDELREMSYLVWAIYQEHAGLMTWRREKLLPLIRVESLLDED